MKFRHKLRVALFPELAWYAHRYLGISWEAIRRKLGHETLIAETRYIARQSTRLEKPDRSLNVVLLTMFPFHTAQHFILGKALERRGHRVTIIMVDSPLPICEQTDIDSDFKRDEVVGYRTAFGMKFARETQFTVIPVSELVPAARVEELRSVHESRWEPYVEAMLLRYFKTGDLDQASPVVRAKRKDAIHAAEISAELGRKIVELSPDRVIITHGSYTSRGPAKDILIDSGVKIVSFQRGKLKDTDVFNWDVASDNWSVDALWPEFREQPFTSEQRGLIEAYLESRLTHEHDQFTFNHTADMSGSETMAKLGLKSGVPVYTMFTNVLWDAASAQKEIAFSSAKEWILKTVEAFVPLTDRQLLVRTHPAESIIGTNCPVHELIARAFPQLPPHIHVLEPNSDVNSWSILKVTDVGIAHTSTVGLELALMGKRCLCVASTHYRNKGFTEDIEDEHQYEAALRRTDYGESEKIRDLALQYSYLFFLKYHMPFPFTVPTTGMGAKYFRQHDLQEMLESPYMRQIVDCVEQRRPFASDDRQVAAFHSHLLAKGPVNG